jgi:hypothetical protein
MRGWGLVHGLILGRRLLAPFLARSGSPDRRPAQRSATDVVERLAARAPARAICGPQATPSATTDRCKRS